MGPGVNDILDPSACSCFPSSYHYMMCNKMKWSTISISIALLIVIVYASSGLYTLIDVSTLMSIQSFNDRNETSLWPITSSPVTIIFSWISLSVYFIIVLLIIILLCGIQLGKPWLLFLWSILMIVMLLADGIVTVLSLRQHQQQPYRPSKQVRILFFVMIIRLIVSLCGIFITVFHFRSLNICQLEYLNRQRMLLRYNTESTSPTYDNSWSRSGGHLNPPKDNSDDHYIPDLSAPPVPLPRAKVATVQRHPTSTIFHSRKSLPHQREYAENLQQRPLSEFHEDFRYNVPLEERFHSQKITGVHEL